jgi:pimeloyl-ACP methyl ester carboxylesterase
MKSKLIFLYTLLLTLIFTGCQSDVAVSYIGDSGRKSYEDSFVFNGSLSAETVNVLGNHLLQKKMEDSPEIFIRELERLYETEPAENILTAIAETSQMIAASMRKSPDIAARYDLTTLLYTSLYITEVTEKNSPRLFAPEAVIAVKCYNQALTELFSYLQTRKLHTASGFELTAAGGQKIHFSAPIFKMPVKSEQIAAFMLCSDFRPKNLTHDSRRFGLGAPLICELNHGAIPGTVFAEDQVIPATLLIKMENDKNQSQQKKAQLYYLDSRSTDDITLKEFQLPLAQDFSTPLAYMVRKPQVFNFLQRTFLIEKTRQSEGLYHLEPHNDDRIPIILVHGLMSDIRTWLQLINTLQSDPELRKNYRFMGFSYSSGYPIFVSAMQLRQALKKERERLIKENRSIEKFDRMILIGHSMGGLLARLLISRSDDEILSGFIGKDTYYNSIDHKDEKFRELMIFEPSPSVKRVIFIAVPHRGSDIAQSWVGKIGSSMIKIPKSLIDFNVHLFRLMLNNPDVNRKMIIKKFNGIDNLSPSGTALRLLNRLPLADIPYHSVIGNRKSGGIPGGSDGVVPYTSSHLDQAESEIVVKSDHSVQQNPLAIQEIKRILKLHLHEKK